MTDGGYRPSGPAGRLMRFAIEAHPPAIYLPLSLLWSLSMVSMLSAGRQFRATDLLVSLVFFLVLLFLRAVDEVKDLEYDRIHNPGRPLVRGAVSRNDIWCVAGLAAAMAIGVSWLISGSLALFVSVNLAYGLGLLALERWSGVFRNSVILNLLVTFPVSAALNVYVYLYLRELASVPTPALAGLVIAAHVAAFLHLEFGRKLRWPHLEPPGGNGYARALGVPLAVAVCVVLGLIACSLASWLHWVAGAGTPWSLLPWISQMASVFGLGRFFRHRHQLRELKPFFGLFLMSFFALNILVTFFAVG